MSVTMFGGTDTSYTEIGGIPQPGVNGQVFATATGADRILGSGGLMAADGVTPTDVVTADGDGFYLFGVNNHPGDVYLDFGRGRKRVHPADVGNRISALETTVAGFGGGGGGAVSSVAGRQGDVVIATTDVSGLPSALTLKADLVTGVIPLAQLPQVYAAGVRQDGTAVVGTLTPGGVPFAKPTTLAYGVVTQSAPPRGSSGTVSFYTKPHATQAMSTAIVATTAAGKMSTFVALPVSVLGQDKWYADVSSVGSAEPGHDITVQVLGVGCPAPPTALAAPNPPSGLTVVNTSSTSNTVSWTAPVGGVAFSGYLLYRTPVGGTITLAGRVRAGTTSFLDTGLTPGTLYTYTLVSHNDDATSTDVVSSLYQYLTSGTFASDWAVHLGSNSGTAATLTGTTLAIVTGSVGGTTNGNAQDPVVMVWGGAATSAAKVTFPITFAESVDLALLFLSSTTLATVTTSWVNGIQLQFGPSFYRVGMKAASYNGGAFFNITSSGTSPAQATTVSGTTSGNVAWTVGTLSLATKYYVTLEALPTGTGLYAGVAVAAGEQVINVYLSTATGSPVLQNQIKLNATQRGAMASGAIELEFLGSQATTGVANHFTLPTNGSDFTVVPLAP